MTRIINPTVGSNAAEMGQISADAWRKAAMHDELVKALQGLGVNGCYDQCRHWGLRGHSPACWAARAALARIAKGE